VATSTKFSWTNRIETATLKNGTGGGAPALDEVTPWLTTQVQNRDRGLVWQAAASLNVDFTLLAAYDVTYFAALGHRGAPSSAVGIASIEVFTQTGAYAAAGTWTTRGTITLGSGVRDGGLTIATQNVNSVRYAITATTAFTLGRLYAGTVEYDLGVVSSPGRIRRRISPRLDQRLAGGQIHLTTSGDVRWEYQLPFVDIDSTLWAKVLAAGSRTQSLLLIDRDASVYEAVPHDGTLSEQLDFDYPDTITTRLDLDTLG